MYFNYTNYIPIVFQLQNKITFVKATKYKIQNTLNVFKIYIVQLLVFELLQHCPPMLLTAVYIEIL